MAPGSQKEATRAESTSLYRTEREHDCRWLAVPVMNRPPNEPSRLAGWTVEDHLDAPPVTVFLQETRFCPQPRSGFEAPRCGGRSRPQHQKRTLLIFFMSCLEPAGVIA